jgi:hypothetical protein
MKKKDRIAVAKIPANQVKSLTGLFLLFYDFFLKKSKYVGYPKISLDDRIQTQKAEISCIWNSSESQNTNFHVENTLWDA